MNFILTVNLTKGQVVRQIVDNSNGTTYIRTATLLPNNPADPISVPSGYVEKSYIAENDTTMKLQANGSIFDNDGNPYAPLLEE